jgi:hypothetical protein
MCHQEYGIQPSVINVFPRQDALKSSPTRGVLYANHLPDIHVTLPYPISPHHPGPGCFGFAAGIGTLTTSIFLIAASESFWSLALCCSPSETPSKYGCRRFAEKGI